MEVRPESWPFGIGKLLHVQLHDVQTLLKSGSGMSRCLMWDTILQHSIIQRKRIR
jgi:hypothetical protein